ncbi:MAG: response regulator [Cyanobacteria bacterium]|nr:response regulator [Cyanobacteriota bacterium]
MKILSVDDSGIMRKIIRGAVDRLGYDFIEAADGQEGLEVLNVHVNEVALILLDWNMPVKDGYETLLEIKKNPVTQHIPVMMVTTEAEKANVIKAIQAGAKNYVSKPFQQEDLIVKMMETLGLGVS